MATVGFWVALLLAAPVGGGAEETLDVVELVPDERASWSPTSLLSPITSLFRGGPGHWYSPREIVIRTTPPGAALDLFYVRRSFQKGFEQGDAPAKVVLPSPYEAGPYDTLRVRAFQDGYQQKEVSVKVRGREDEILIELEPLRNSLVGATHLYFADRASISFLTKEHATFRVQKAQDGYSLILLETGITPEAAESLAAANDALVASLGAQQLGQDLVVRVVLTDSARDSKTEVRQRQSYDAVRRMNRFTLDIVPENPSSSSVQRARNALAKIRRGDVTGCSLRYEDTLRENLEPADLARALTPSGAFTDPYLRAAMKRLGEVSPGGTVVLADGTTYRPEFPIELSAASSQAAEVQGYLALLRRFVMELEAAPYRRETLRGLLAPEMGPSDFDAIVDASEAAERACLASAR